MERTYAAHMIHFFNPKSRLNNTYLNNCLVYRMERKAEGVVAHRENTQNVIEEAQDEFTINL